MQNRKSAPTVEEVFSFVLKVENDLDLINWKVAGEPIWGTLRHGFCQNLFRAAGALENSKDTIPKEIFNFYKKFRVVTNIFSAAFRLRLLNKLLRKPRAVGVFPFYRRNAMNEDVHSKDVIEKLGNRAFLFGVGEEDKKILGRLHRAGLNSLFSRLFGSSADRWIRRNLTRNDYELYKQLVTRCEEEFAIKLSGSWGDFPVKLLKSYLTESRGYELLFRLLNFSSIFVVSAIQQGIIGGARKAGIRLIELQHGAVSKYHPMFNWPEGTEIATVPNEFWTWGESWIHGIRFSKTTRPIVVGASSSFEAVRNSPEEETKGLVSFMSSADVTEKLFDCALRCALANPELSFIYKCHPREDITAQKRQLASRGDVNNLTISGKEYNAVNLIKRSEYVVGVHSAALFEAAGMGKKVLVVKVSGWEIAQELIEAQGATASSPDLASQNLKSTPRSKNQYFFYSKSVDVDLANY